MGQIKSRSAQRDGTARAAAVNNIEKVHSLGALKIICVFFLFWWHSPLAKPVIDIGARCCEFLFVTSGFLVAYNHSEAFRAGPGASSSPSWKDSFIYLKKKLCAMWPLHIICFIICALCDTSVFKTPFGVFNGILNIFLLQSWFGRPEIFFAFNGPSWFLSSLLFCYFVSPLLLKGLKTRRSAVFSFIIVTAARLLIESFELSEYGALAPVSIYVFPIVRAMEFYCGMTVFRLHRAVSARISSRGGGAALSPVFSAAEIISLTAAVTFIIAFNDKWMRGCYVLMYCAVVLIFSFDSGIVSGFIGGTEEHAFPSAVLRGLGKFEFEIFILHKTVLILISSAFPDSDAYAVRITLISLVITLALAVLWKELLGKRCAAAMDGLFRLAESFFGYKI